MKRNLTGRYETTSAGGEIVRAFIPKPLPPDPPLILHGPIQVHLEQALLPLGRLDSISTLLPDPSLLLYAYVQKEAALSSQMEETQSFTRRFMPWLKKGIRLGHETSVRRTIDRFQVVRKHCRRYLTNGRSIKLLPVRLPPNDVFPEAGRTRVCFIV